MIVPRLLARFVSSFCARSGDSRSSGLITSRMMLVATASSEPSCPTSLAEQHLDDAHIDVLLEQMRRERVPQRVRRDPLR